MCPHLFSDVVPVHVALTGIHLLLVQETTSVRNQQGLTYILSNWEREGERGGRGGEEEEEVMKKEGGTEGIIISSYCTERERW